MLTRYARSCERYGFQLSRIVPYKLHYCFRYSTSRPAMRLRGRQASGCISVSCVSRRRFTSAALLTPSTDESTLIVNVNSREDSAGSHVVRRGNVHLHAPEQREMSTPTVPDLSTVTRCFLPHKARTDTPPSLSFPFLFLFLSKRRSPTKG